MAGYTKTHSTTGVAQSVYSIWKLPRVQTEAMIFSENLISRTEYTHILPLLSHGKSSVWLLPRLWTKATIFSEELIFQHSRPDTHALVLLKHSLCTLSELQISQTNKTCTPSEELTYPHYVKASYTQKRMRMHTHTHAHLPLHHTPEAWKSLPCDTFLSAAVIKIQCLP